MRATRKLSRTNQGHTQGHKINTKKKMGNKQQINQESKSMENKDETKTYTHAGDS